jgi:hypothetical protein
VIEVKSSTHKKRGPRAGSKSERIREALKANPGQTRKEVAEKFDASYGLAEKIVSEVRGGKKQTKKAGKAKQSGGGDTGDDGVAAKAISFIEAAGGLQQAIDILQVAQKISVTI